MDYNWASALLLLSACVQQPSVAVSPSAPVAVAAAKVRAEPARPALDHHQHLLSDAARKVTLDWFNGWPLQAVELPIALKRLLTLREAAWTDKSALAPLFHPRAVMLGRGEAGWISGRDKIVDELSKTFGRPYQMRPVAYATDGSSGYIAGYYTRGVGTDTSYVGYFHLDLVRTGGNWSIMGEMPRFPGPKIEPLVDADQIVKMLDDAMIPKALVFSNAYYFGRGPTEASGEYKQVRAENDWTSGQVRLHPGRLYAACSTNPLRQYAVAEIERCVQTRSFVALKLHFDGSSVDLKDASHLASVRKVFTAANTLRLPIIVHLQSEAGFGGEHARIFLSELLPIAADVPVTINHLWGGGGYASEAAESLAVFAAAFARKDPAVRDLWFDLAQIAMAAPSEADRAQIAQRMRQIGFSRMLYGSDGPQYNGLPPKQHWEDFLAKMPLTRDEFNLIAANVAPYMR